MDNMTIAIIFAILAGVIGYAIMIYNRLVAYRQDVEEGWSGIEVQLKRRTDLIPNLLETVKGYMGHERETLEAVTEMRTRAQAVPDSDVAGRAQAEGLLSQALGKLFAVAENYPDLKASQNFKDFQDSLEDTENQLEMARRYYNGTVNQFNTLVQQFPANLIAKPFDFIIAEYFELDNPADWAVPDVSFS